MTLKDILTITKETFENKSKENEHIVEELFNIRVSKETTKQFELLIKKHCFALNEKDLVDLLCEAIYYMRDDRKINFFETIFDLYDIE